MAHHYWGDEDFDWNALSKAVSFFQKNLSRWARIGCYAKEKYGTLRLDFFSMHFDPYHLVFPGRLYIHPWWFYHISYKYFTPILRYTGIGYCIHQYQRFMFNLLTIIAIKKWPHIREEITDEYEFQALLYKWVKNKIGYENRWNSYNSGDNHENDTTDS